MWFRSKKSQSSSSGDTGAPSFESSALFESAGEAGITEYRVDVCNGKRIALGVSYLYAGNKVLFAELSKLAVKDGCEVRSFRISEGAGAGLLAAIPLSHADCWLGAVLIAQVIGSGIFMQNIGGGRYWILAAADGLPISRRDRIVESEDQAHQVMMGFMSDLGQTSVFGDCSGAQRTAQECWSDVSDLLKSDHIPKAIKRFAAPRKKLSLLHILSLAIVFSALAFVGYVSWTMVSAPDVAPEQDRLAFLMQQMKTEQARSEQQRRLRVAFESRVQEHANHAMRGSFAKQFPFIQEAIDRFPRLDAPAKFVGLECSSAGRLPEQDWNCIPSVQMSRAMGFVPILRANPDDPLVREAVQQGSLIGEDLVVTLSPYQERMIGFADISANPWPRLNPLEWKAYVSDYVRHKGLAVEQIESIRGLPDIVVASQDFADGEVRLEGVADRSVAHVMEMSLAVPLASRSMASLHSAFVHRPAHIQAFRISEGRLYITLHLTLHLTQQ